MQEASFKHILESATAAKRSSQEWHHHYLPPGCALNSSDEHAIILEVAGNDTAYVCYFDEKPLDKLEQLENPFFDR